MPARECAFCGDPATVHLTEIVQNATSEVHLCEECARAHRVLAPPGQEVDVPGVLHLFLALKERPRTESGGLICPACGLGYHEFQAAGRLGCPHDYEAFGTALAGLLERIHRADRHGGKVPRRHPGGDAELRRQLRRAVREERFEDAARLRDLIRRRQAPDEPERHAPEPG